MKHNVYLIENILNQKKYVGFTKNNIKKRFKQHMSSTRPIGIAIRKYGKDNFSIKLLQVCGNIDDAIFCEKKYIAEYRTYGCGLGYNCSVGGEQCAPIVNRDVWQSKSFKNKVKTNAIKQHNDPITKQRHLDGIQKYWKSLDEVAKLIKVNTARNNGKKSTVAWNKGNKFPGTGMGGDKNPMAKNYVVFHPCGKQEIITCLETFCKINKLTSRNVYYVLEGKQKHHKNFRFARLENPQ